MNTKKEYIAPALTVVSFKVEQGIALSGFSTLNLFHDIEVIPDPYSGYNVNNQENWSSSDNIFGETGWDY